MPIKRKAAKKVATADYRHAEDKRTNIPPAKIAGEGMVPKLKKARYHYSPHLPPELRFDPSGEADKLPEVIAEAGKRTLTKDEQKLLAEALRNHEPWLEWAGKREQHEKGYYEVDPVALHIHERVSAQACVRTAMREDVQKDLFADPQQEYREAVQFYKHDMDWANRLILGDSLQVMSSLAKRENLTGKVQMIYIDPPYGIKFASNFQPELGVRKVNETDAHLTREVEIVKAYRDTWSLGLHSYVAYLKERLITARDLLNDSGCVFVQINSENEHIVRQVMGEVFGARNFIANIVFRKKTLPLGARLLETMHDHILFYGKNKEETKYKPQYVFSKDLTAHWKYAEFINGSRTNVGLGNLYSDEHEEGTKYFRLFSLLAPSYSKNTDFLYEYNGQWLPPPSNGSWVISKEKLDRLARADRFEFEGKTLAYVLHHLDFPYRKITNLWNDVGVSFQKSFVVQTSSQVVGRCISMSTDPGDLVLDPTCGSGTTAITAEQMGRRWISIDSSRVAISIARQRILTAKYDYFDLKDEQKGVDGGFNYKTVSHITLKSITQNTNLDPIFEKYESILHEKLLTCNAALEKVGDDLRTNLKTKLATKQKAEGKRAITDADNRRWLLPPTNRDPKIKLTVDKKFSGWYHWEVPFDTDPDYPRALSDAVTAYREAWREKMDEVDACISANADQEELVDQPNMVNGVVRVSGPFTVEGVHPEELNLGEEGLFDGTPNEFEVIDGVEDDSGRYEVQNLQAYLDRMVHLIRADGLTFINNQEKKFARVEPLFDSGIGTVLHAEGVWADGDESGPSTVAIGFGPQYGPVTAQQVEELIRSSKRYDELVIAGFSFDAAASAVIQENAHPKLTIHQAYIRPDVSPGMDGLLKDTPSSQLFTVFGQPEVELSKTDTGEYVVELQGVDIYDPVKNTINSTGAEKVAAWFLDSDFDGRTFCITQAFFPNRNAWDKLAKALKTSAGADVFEQFKGTTSLSFPAGEYKRIAVKVIDPRGNEVMAIRELKD